MTKTAKNQEQKIKKLHELIGKVRSKDLRKSYDHKEACPQAELKAGQECPEVNCYHGSAYYRLNVALENSPAERIYVYRDRLEKEQIWKDIEECDKIFACVLYARELLKLTIIFLPKFYNNIFWTKLIYQQING